MIEKDKILYLVLGLTIAILLAVILWQSFGKRAANYYALYLSNGNIYFGKLKRFSHYTLIDPYFLTITQDEGNPFIIRRFRDAFWGPSGKLRFNPENVIWITKLDPNSVLINYMEGREKGTIFPQPQLPQPQTPPEETPPEETPPSE